MSGRESNWDEKMKHVHENYPQIMEVDWEKLFTVDSGILGDLINDLIRVANSSLNPGRRGKRSNVDRDTAKNSLARLQGLDYSTENFVTTLNKLKGERSIRKFAKDIGIGPSKVQRLLDGTTLPNNHILITIAKAHDKDPSFFLEYRVAAVSGFVSNVLTQYPETSIVQFRKLSK